MKLFYTKRSPLAHIVRVLANELDVSLELEETTIRDPNSALLEYTPAGRVPALLMSDGITICDHRLVCKVIADVAERPDIFSSDNAGMSVEGEAIALIEAYMKVFQEGLRDKTLQSDAVYTLEIERIERILNWLEERTEIIGTKVSYRAAVIACAFMFNERFSITKGPSAELPKLLAWYQAFSNQPAFANSL